MDIQKNTHTEYTENNCADTVEERTGEVHTNDSSDKAANAGCTENKAQERTRRASKTWNILRIVLAAVLAAGLFLASVFAIVVVDLGEYMDEYQNNMRIVLENVEYGYEAQKIPDQIVNVFREQEYCALTGMAAVAVEKQGYSRKLVEGIRETIGCEQICVVLNGEDRADLPQLSGDEWKVLRNQEILQRDKDILTYKCFSGQEIIIRWDIPVVMENRDLFRFAGEGHELQIVDLENGCVIGSNFEEQCDQKYENLYGEKIAAISFEEFEGEDQIENNDEWTTTCGIKRDRKGALYFYLEHVSEDGKLMLANHVSLKRILGEIFHFMSPQLLLMLLVYGMVLFYAIRLFRARICHGKASGKRLFKKVWIDSSFYSHISAFLLVSACLAMFLTLYLQALINYSTQNIRANRNLQLASRFVEQTLNDKKNVEEIYADICTDTLLKISDMIDLEPACAEQENLLNLTTTLAVKELTIYDADGVSIASSGNNTGYRLSEERGHLEYTCREFIGEANNSKVLKETDSDNWWILAKRKNAPGVLVMKMGREWVESITRNLTIGDALACMTFDQADALFVILDEPETTYRIRPHSFEVEKLDVVMDERLLSGKFTGQTRIDGIRYYVNELQTDQVLYISAMREDRNWARVLICMVCELIGFLLLFAMLLLLFAITGDDYMKHAENKHTKLSDVLSMDNLTDSDFRKMLGRMLKLTVVLLFIVIFIEFSVYSNEVIRYLFGSQWERKLNLFSITIILFYAIAARILCEVVTKIIMLIARNMGQRSVTIGHMICSLLRFGTLMAWSMNTLVELGMELRYLLTGAGIVGVVIGYACQGVINDLLNGLFIVFEGNFQVGDWVRVDDWRGEVLMIGVRTTKIGFGGDIRVFNNSCLNTITVLSHTMDGALCYVSIAYEEDVESVANLIRGNEEQYRVACPHIMEGPGVHGVTSLGESGVTLRLWARVDDQQYVAAAERAVLKETKRLFDENGITIPFPQIVLHDGNEKKER